MSSNHFVAVRLDDERYRLFRKCLVELGISQQSWLRARVDEEIRRVEPNFVGDEVRRYVKKAEEQELAAGNRRMLEARAQKALESQHLRGDRELMPLPKGMPSLSPRLDDDELRYGKGYRG